ncbi:glycoside hydrolase family 28 protein [Aulographum hederae CBS 113979]|uniref:Glycoside hydrolase family 28 protein n=1 Tax=Aulographum hederae CBS 113979 TaxID=1176131 RepID=A0A6G1H6N9_9PEZI|nr:glycoside hydrolase family 28 protein [Aulographum hederae CBS 113979]
MAPRVSQSLLWRFWAWTTFLMVLFHHTDRAKAAPTPDYIQSLGVVGGAWVEKYPTQKVHSLSGVYTLKINGESVDVIDYSSSMTPYDYAHFGVGTSGAVRVEITKNGGGAVNSCAVSPWKLGIQASRSGSTCSFTVQEKHYLIVKIDDLRPLVLMMDDLEDKPDLNAANVYDVVKKYGADDTGVHFSHEAMQKALDDACAAGGGTVYVPPGLYLVGNLVLPSNTRFHLAGGSVLRYMGYHGIYEKWFSKYDRGFTFWLRTAMHSSNVQITGRGVIDGNGKETFGVQSNYGVTILAPMVTSNFIYNGPIIREASFWAFSMISVTGAHISNLKILDRMDMGENDGLDINQSKDVVVSRAISIAWDDPFSTKTWTKSAGGIFSRVPGNDPDDPAEPTPNQNVLFEDLVSWTGCWGAKVGQGHAQAHRNITFRSLTVFDAAVGIGVHHRYGTSPADGVLFEDVDIERLSWSNDDKTTWLAVYVQDSDRGVGEIKDVTVRNVRLWTMGKTPAIVQGFSDQVKVTNVVLENIRPEGLGRPARTLEEINLTKVGFQGSLSLKS